MYSTSLWVASPCHWKKAHHELSNYSWCCHSSLWIWEAGGNDPLLQILLRDNIRQFPNDGRVIKSTPMFTVTSVVCTNLAMPSGTSEEPEQRLKKPMLLLWLIRQALQHENHSPVWMCHLEGLLFVSGYCWGRERNKKIFKMLFVCSHSKLNTGELLQVN